MDCDSSVLLETDLGSVVVDLRGKFAPKAVAEFVRLCECGYFRNNLVFKVERDFIAVTGDPTGTGKGGDSFQSLFDRLEGRNSAAVNNNKFVPVETASDDDASTWTGHVLCSLSSQDNNIPFSQFFITLSEAGSHRYSHLKGRYTVLGRVAEDGSDVIRALSNTFVDDVGRPLRDVRLRSTIVLVYPPHVKPLTESTIKALKKLTPDPAMDVPAEEWDKIEERPSVFSNEVIDDEEEMLKRKEETLAETRAVELEILGDITSAEARPEENVLFVCKLNPTTKSEDLKLIFSRFGDVTDCEVKRDPVTHESLQYAFVGFASKEQCEEAYKKMQDVMIDGRRIRVDFSQSEGKRRSQIESQTREANQPEKKTLSLKLLVDDRSTIDRRRRERSSSESSASSYREKSRKDKRRKEEKRRRSRSSSSSEDSRRHRKKDRHKRKDERKSSHNRRRGRSRSRDRGRRH